MDETDLWVAVTHVRRDPDAPRDRRNQRIGLEVAVPAVSAAK